MRKLAGIAVLLVVISVLMAGSVSAFTLFGDDTNCSGTFCFFAPSPSSGSSGGAGPSPTPVAAPAVVPGVVAGAGGFQGFLQMNWLVEVGLIDTPLPAVMGFVILLVLLVLGMAAYGIANKFGIPNGYCALIAFFVVALSFALMPRAIVFVAAAEYTTLFSVILIGLPIALLGVLFWVSEPYPWARFFVMLLIMMMWYQSRSVFAVPNAAGVAVPAISGTQFSTATYDTIRTTMFSGWIMTIMWFILIWTFLSAISSHASTGVNADSGSLMDKLRRFREGFGNATRGQRDAATVAATGHATPAQQAAAAQAVAQVSERDAKKIHQDAGNERSTLLQEYVDEKQEVELLSDLEECYNKATAIIGVQYENVMTNIGAFQFDKIDTVLAQYEQVLGEVTSRLDEVLIVTRRQERTGTKLIADLKGHLPANEIGELLVPEKRLLKEHETVKDKVNTIALEYKKVKKSQGILQTLIETRVDNTDPNQKTKFIGQLRLNVGLISQYFNYKNASPEILDALKEAKKAQDQAYVQCQALVAKFKGYWEARVPAATAPAGGRGRT